MTGGLGGPRRPHVLPTSPRTEARRRARERAARRRRWWARGFVLAVAGGAVFVAVVR